MNKRQVDYNESWCWDCNRDLAYWAVAVDTQFGLWPLDIGSTLTAGRGSRGYYGWNQRSYLRFHSNNYFAADHSNNSHRYSHCDRHLRNNTVGNYFAHSAGNTDCCNLHGDSIDF
jgi:hypothetical protein